MLKKSQKLAALISTPSIAMLVFFFSNPAVAERACVKTDAGKVVCGELVEDGNNRTAPKPNSSIPLDGKYSFSWTQDANQTSGCVPSAALDELIIFPNGLMNGHYSGKNSSTDFDFNGKINPDGTWSGNIPATGYRFEGNIRDGKVSGTYTAQSEITMSQQQCIGTVTGFKKPK
ncbi:hypothetical protein NIES2100_64280 [Calothrix sp. NIES-2100]|nr:hypothetical protein NIES2100_64280 [Calothrix sp. NIES-2100]